jgi:hypothetical protein
VTDIRNEIAEHIRRADGGNRLTARELGERLAMREDLGQRVVEFVEAANPDKTMGAGALADAIVDRFGLDPEEAA